MKCLSFFLLLISVYAGLSQDKVYETGATWKYSSVILTNSFSPRTNTPITVMSVTGLNSGLIDQWVQVFDTNGVPSAGAIPEISIPVPAGKGFSITFPRGAPYARGFWVINSTTATALTQGSKDCLFQGTFAPR